MRTINHYTTGDLVFHNKRSAHYQVLAWERNGDEVTYACHKHPHKDDSEVYFLDQENLRSGAYTYSGLAMPKFRVGDRVKDTDDGQLGTITQVLSVGNIDEGSEANEWPYSVVFDGPSNAIYCCNESELEAVT